jgi:hypothetical protein
MAQDAVSSPLPRSTPRWRSALPWPLSHRGRLIASALLVAVPALLLYSRTLMRDVGFWDTAEFQAIGPVLGIAHPTGYPSYTLLAWLASVVLQPFGNEALRANLLSALLVAAGCGIVGATVTQLTGRLVAGVGAGIGLALCAEAWTVALHADPHALHLFLVAALLALLVVWRSRVRDAAPGRAADRWLVAAAALFGVSLGNHGLTILLAPAVGLYVLAVEPAILKRPRTMLACVAALLLTTVALYLYLPIRSAMDPPLDYANPETWDGFRYLVFAEQFRGTFQALPGLVDAVRLMIGETWAQLGLLAALALLGAVHGALRRPAIVLLLGTWFVVNWFFALGYVNADIGRYYLVPLLSVAVLGGLGAAALIDAARDLARRSLQRGRRPMRVAIAAVAALLLTGPIAAAIPDRLPRLDQSDDVTARGWLEEMGQQLPQGAVVVSWWSFSTPLWYAQYVEGWRPDIAVIDDRTMLDRNLGSVENVIDSHLGQRPVFLIRLPYDLPRFRDRYELARVSGVSDGPVYEVVGRVSTGEGTDAAGPPAERSEVAGGTNL